VPRKDVFALGEYHPRAKGYPPLSPWKSQPEADGGNP
jgi:hypothetical protein